MSTRRALALSFADRYAGLLLGIVSSMVVARLLTPQEIGAFSVVVVLLSFVSALRDFGAGQYLLQEKELTPLRIRATWTVLLATGIGVAILVALLAKPLAAFYADTRMADIMWVLALNFAINPVASLSYAWLMREMRFGALAAMRLGSSLAGACVSVLLAWQGHGPISLALGSLASTLVNALLAVAFRPPQFSWRPTLHELRRVVSFGGRISATALVNNVSAGAPELLLGKLQDLASAAYYSRAAGLAAMFQKLVLDATQAVALPMFARVVRERGDIAPPLLHAVSYVTVLGWSFFGALALLADPIIHLLYGDQWTGAVELTRWLALAMAIGLPASMCPVALSASGGVSRMMRVSLGCAAIHVTLVGAAAGFGMRAVGLAAVAAQAIAVALWLRAAGHGVGLRWRPMAARLCGSAVVVLASLCAPLATVAMLGDRPAVPLAALALAAIGQTALFVAVAVLTRHPIREELQRVRLWMGSRLRPSP